MKIGLTGNQNMKQLYESNADFKQYVDRCRTSGGYHTVKTLEYVLSLALTREVAEMYQENQEGKTSGVQSTFTPIGECV